MGRVMIKYRRLLNGYLSSNWAIALTGVVAFVAAVAVDAGTLEQAKRIHDRLAGVPPTEQVLLQMKAELDGNDGDATDDGIEAAMIAMENDAFYNVTLKTWAAPWTNREQNVFVPLNDYIATVIGAVRDELDFRTICTITFFTLEPLRQRIPIPAMPTMKSWKPAGQALKTRLSCNNDCSPR